MYESLFDYLKSATLLSFDQLYNHPPTCLAVFRELPELCKHFVMRLLFIEQPVPKQVIAAWVHRPFTEEHQEACRTLEELRVWYLSDMSTARAGWRLNRRFQENFRIALLGGGESWTGDPSLEPDKHAKDLEFLERYARERWECLLHFMVGSQASGEVSVTCREVLIDSELMKKDNGAYGITQKGFQFLLMDRPNQVWRFMLHYLDYKKARELNLAESLQFLFQLSFSTFGKSYPVSHFSETHMTMLQHLREFGLAFQRKRTSHRFYPTRLAVGLATGLQKMSTPISLPGEEDAGFIVVETNYRICAYTDSPLKTALIGLFCEILYRFPNLVVANLTRDSVRSALVSGISADQIIGFLTSNAHQEMKKQMPILPPTIVDQIHLWELERDRFNFEEGCMYEQFLSNNDFELLRDYARDNGVLLWENPEKRIMIVTKPGHEEVRRFWRRHRQGD